MLRIYYVLFLKEEREVYFIHNDVCIFVYDKYANIKEFSSVENVTLEYIFKIFPFESSLVLSSEKEQKNVLLN